jgi:hypothetical protein
MCDGYKVLQLVEALPFKFEGRRFKFRWCILRFLIDYSFPPHWPRVSQPLNRNKHQGFFMGRIKTDGA